MRFVTIALLALIAAFCSGMATADSYTLQAVSDFDDIDAGEVPYYLDDARGVLAIDAAIAAYREKFARATSVFSGPSGVYDVTIIAIGEIDGEGEYRFLVDGVVAGTAVNQLVQTDWGEQRHVFADISLEAGAEIGVESNARSNGLIPENGEFAFARGRWKSLQLDLDTLATGVGSSVDLAVAVSVSPQPAITGDDVVASVTVSNQHTQTVATNILLSASLTDELRFLSGSGCTVTAAVVNCQLADIAPGGSLEIDVMFETLDSGSAVAIFNVLSPQIDTNTDNNSATAPVVILPTTLPAGSGISDSQITDATTGTSQNENDSQTTMQTVATSGGSSGGGSLGILLLVVLSSGLRMKSQART